ncbi:ABC transporter, ATP-binding protein [Minicystis rosea]|nr:ABC transporter, ATP-binding protein [Minicystis rosea]
MTTLLEASDVSITTPSGRPLFAGMNLRLGRERVALIGRNGVGKSTLLAVLAGEIEPQAGRVRAWSEPHHVPQAVGSLPEPIRSRPLSHGERRKLALIDAARSGADILLLDEPTEDLDDASVAWLRGWLRKWTGCLVVASHDRRLLDDFEHFFIASESGCRAFSGTAAALEAELEREHHETEERYARNLRRLVEQEAHTLHVANRKARKKRYGRCSEIDRATPRMRLNQKRDHAQVSHGRLAQVREQRIDALRAWSKSTRQALGVSLSLDLLVPTLPAEAGPDVIALQDVSAERGNRRLFASLDLRVRRDRVAVVGPNGAGKTTLLDVVLGRCAPATGSAFRDSPRIGSIAQGAADWMLEDTLLGRLCVEDSSLSLEASAELLAAHKFPLALGERSLRSLSPGERARAALICLFRRRPPVEVLVLDEPTYSLDLVGQRAMTEALRAWPGGLVVASHDRAFLTAIGVDVFLEVNRADE